MKVDLEGLRMIVFNLLRRDKLERPHTRNNTSFESKDGIPMPKSVKGREHSTAYSVKGSTRW